MMEKNTLNLSDVALLRKAYEEIKENNSFTGNSSQVYVGSYEEKNIGEVLGNLAKKIEAAEKYFKENVKRVQEYLDTKNWERFHIGVLHLKKKLSIFPKNSQTISLKWSQVITEMELNFYKKLQENNSMIENFIEDLSEKLKYFHKKFRRSTIEEKQFLIQQLEEFIESSPFCSSFVLSHHKIRAFTTLNWAKKYVLEEQKLLFSQKCETIDQLFVSLQKSILSKNMYISQTIFNKIMFLLSSISEEDFYSKIIYYKINKLRKSPKIPSVIDRQHYTTTLEKIRDFIKKCKSCGNFPQNEITHHSNTLRSFPKGLLENEVRELTYELKDFGRIIQAQKMEKIRENFYNLRYETDYNKLKEGFLDIRHQINELSIRDDLKIKLIANLRERVERRIKGGTN